MAQQGSGRGVSEAVRKKQDKLAGHGPFSNVANRDSGKTDSFINYNTT